MAKKKLIPKTTIYSIPTEAFDKPLLITIVIGEPTTELDSQGRYNPCKGEIHIHAVGWQETLYHEILEGSILVNMAHYSNDYDPDDILISFNHRRFTSICSYASSTYTKLLYLLLDLFVVDGNAIIGLNDYGHMLVRKKDLEVEEVF